eukprot:CAMPEP_0185748168 /NCGR_PEP_ID=MMETSP1174-20130828/6842_1 /TAXON_ID=35687 /ORGANISM="Dictyocha speculum, Strain CCMP1381" /LENGTH=483 /DNA_ID=CAMNT_0028423701 /DNA_START=12 /DNA_END=1460 /DNA_ORIENTATION=+
MPQVNDISTQAEMKPMFQVCIMDGKKIEKYSDKKSQVANVEHHPVAIIPVYDLDMTIKDVRAQANEQMKMKGTSHRVEQGRLTYAMDRVLNDDDAVIDVCYGMLNTLMSNYEEKSLNELVESAKRSGKCVGEVISCYLHTLDVVSDPYGIDEVVLGDENETGVADEEEQTAPTFSFVPIAKLNSPNASRALICPGQGTQTVGMARHVLEGPEAEAAMMLFSRASDILGYDLLDVVMNGPDERLQTTEVSQPAVLVTTLAALATTQDRSKIECGAVAGFSLGEYTALVVSGALDLEDTLRLLKVRAESMQKACEMTSGSMLSVVGLDEETLGLELMAAKEATGCEVLEIANYLFPKGFTISGSTEGCEWLKMNLPEKGALSVKMLNTAGAFHTSFMEQAQSDLVAAIEAAPFRVPEMPLYSNVTAEPMTTVEEIKDCLSKQMSSSVKWHQIMENMLASGTDNFLEPGPGKQLKSMMKRIDMSAW